MTGWAEERISAVESVMRGRAKKKVLAIQGNLRTGSFDDGSCLLRHSHPPKTSAVSEFASLKEGASLTSSEK